MIAICMQAQTAMMSLGWSMVLWLMLILSRCTRIRQISCYLTGVCLHVFHLTMARMEFRLWHVIHPTSRTGIHHSRLEINGCKHHPILATPGESLARSWAKLVQTESTQIIHSPLPRISRLRMCSLHQGSTQRGRMHL